MYKALAGLVSSGQLVKEGKVPQVFYTIGVQNKPQLSQPIRAAMEVVSNNVQPSTAEAEPVSLPKVDLDPEPQDLNWASVFQWVFHKLAEAEECVKPFKTLIICFLAMFLFFLGYQIYQYCSSFSENNRLRQKLSDTNLELNKTRRDLYNIQNELNQKLSVKVDGLNASVNLPTSYMSIDEIVSWTKHGMTSQEIIQHIKDTQSSYKLTSTDVQYLREFNVSDDVISAMK
ncbi:MAG: hypothetical protein HQL15_07005 [Candidatus Omnitrophica bacterium]|nr:hypothetical protein [Candidatus Omnitrophota bacterium]